LFHFGNVTDPCYVIVSNSYSGIAICCPYGLLYFESVAANHFLCFERVPYLGSVIFYFEGGTCSGNGKREESTLLYSESGIFALF